MVDSIAISLLLLAAAPPVIPSSGAFRLPAGVVEISRELAIPEGALDLTVEGHPAGTTLRAADDFQGRGLLVLRGARRVVVRNLSFDGNRSAVGRPAGLPPSDVPFSRFTPANGILAEDSTNILIQNAQFREVAGFAVLVSRCAGVKIENIHVASSGGRNSKGRNNTTGGILIEEGTEDFEVLDSTFRDVLGNAVWTHSNYHSPRNARGRIAGNRFERIARDAIQVGHATQVRVEDNSGERIGWPVDAVDVEGGGTPVAIDTAGNVDLSVYTRNRFHEINGKCIDLDGFHRGEVSRNVCVNRGRAEDYPFGHFAIVFNNTNPGMQSEHIRIEDNEIDGTKYGGIFLIGSNHTVLRNRMRRLNLAGCTENAAKFSCYYFEDEPDLLRTGIYLGRRAERPAPAQDNRIEQNEISGHKMAARCIAAAPGVSLKRNRIAGNRCRDEK